ncbi:MAG: hypothetical protein IPP90_20940 [Gemmatimonadaceae bacterium]|nr:hypothetical protein [Gemmatimonadaceae bacterium]
MRLLSEFFNRLRDLPALVQWAGYVGLTIIIFSRDGPAGRVLPPRRFTPLVTAGLRIAGRFRPERVAAGCYLECCRHLMGNSVGTRSASRRSPIFTRARTACCSTRRICCAHAFYEKHGGKTIIMAQFAPIVRTFVPVVAVGEMSYRSFVTYNVIGAIAWI